MQKHVLVVHGAGVQRLRRGSVYWKAKLEDALRAGFEVSCPKMPNPASPRYLYHSRNDPEVPFEHLALYAEKLPQATVRPLDGREHEFHKAALPELVDDIRACLGKPLRETLKQPQPV